VIDILALVTPAQAGVHAIVQARILGGIWIPAFAGMTGESNHG